MGCYSGFLVGGWLLLNCIHLNCCFLCDFSIRALSFATHRHFCLPERSEGSAVGASAGPSLRSGGQKEDGLLFGFLSWGMVIVELHPFELLFLCDLSIRALSFAMVRPFCLPERSEGSDVGLLRVLRYAQEDKREDGLLFGFLSWGMVIVEL